MIETLFNDVTLDGMRRVRLVSDLDPIPFCAPDGANVRHWTDSALGLHYLEATWPCREVVKIHLEGQPSSRPMALWKLMPGERVSVAFRDACANFAELFKTFPDYAFMRRLPKEIESGFEMADVMFFEADWVPQGCIAVGSGG